ncbi:MAG: hypothetical protein LBC82_08940 [Oscillospiraceae bacterium]|jgi:hypothetical protein|nr:hypothetical protein [Oscillospiraceae bacterium]
MAINTIEYGAVFQKELDKQVLEGSTSGWMEENAGQVIYSGGKEIKLPLVSTQGLADYDRDTGYSSGAVTFTYETYKMNQDRGRRFRLDAVDVDETAFALSAANVAGEFQRTRVIPEIDAYRYSKLASLAGIKSDYIPNADDVFSELTAGLGQVMDITGGEGEIVVVISRPVYDALLSSPEILKTIEVGSFKQGEVDFEVKYLNGACLIPVPSARMKTAYSFLSGNEGGFTPANNAKDINWIICPKNAPIAVSKTDNVKIIAPESNQFADAWDIDYRKYHDLFLPKNKQSVVAVSVKG